MKVQALEPGTVVEPQEMTRREEIMQIAASLFVDKGYKATTVRLIADAANVQSGSLYHHFGSKDEIVDELLGKYVRNALLRYEEVIATTDKPEEQVQKLIESAMDAVHSHRAALLLLQQDGRWLAEQPRFSYLNEVGSKIETLWRNTVKSGIDAGVFNPEIDPIVPFYMVRDAVMSAARWFNPQGKWTVTRWTRQCVILILSGLCTPGKVVRG
ncbi:TetR/AcrR family transcriptional regulator [Ramlibacter henchirensis]|uniref:TetR/AcrR family transcriptional regulator n=2 Tax=Ramlibacter henchirensis TaxID=204072 RepID=A0A4Z0BU96_9BURK|nr:TetR/AcrR family transcriptional regulator [Ramlibacter henchirensis]